MTVVISDTSPLRYLVVIGVADVLPQLFGEVIVPPAVVDELRDAGAPQMVREWLAAKPDWLAIQSPAAVKPFERLGAGESAAIALAMERRADLLLVDDRAARTAAQRMGIPVVGTLAVLDLGARRKLLDFRQALAELESRTNFRVSTALRDSLLREHQEGR